MRLNPNIMLMERMPMQCEGTCLHLLKRLPFLNSKLWTQFLWNYFCSTTQQPLWRWILIHNAKWLFINEITRNNKWLETKNYFPCMSLKTAQNNKLHSFKNVLLLPFLQDWIFGFIQIFYRYLIIIYPHCC